MISQLLLAATQTAEQSTEATFWLPPGASTTSSSVDPLFNFIMGVSIFFFVLVMAVLAYFVIKYRKRSDDDKTSPISGNHRLEIVWSLIPAVILVVMFVWGFKGFINLSVPPDNAMEIRVIGQKWFWEFSYPIDGITVRKGEKLVVPINKPVKLVMSSEDVLHAMFIPAFRIKRDVLPNRYSVIWFEATKLGEYDIFCAEYCGDEHSKMTHTIKVVSAAEYEAWKVEAASGGDMTPAQLGKKLFTGLGCVACHSTSKDKKKMVGPPLFGLYGNTETLTDGKTVKVDDKYIRSSLIEPNSQIVKGFAPAMPPYKGRLKEKEMAGMIEYIKSLK
jgi:cytochrome c oxidase subunit II